MSQPQQLEVTERAASVASGVKVKVKVTEVPLFDKVLLLGPPGIGKTEIIKQKAEEEARRMGRVFIDVEEWVRSGKSLRELYEMVSKEPNKYYLYYRIVATHVTKEDLSIIYPDFKLDAALPMPQLVFKLFSLRKPDCKGSDEECAVAGTLFIDEITNVSDEATVTAFYALIQEKRVGWSVSMPSTVKVVAAGNRPTESSAANLLPAPLVNRMTVIDVVAPTLGEWINYMNTVYRDRYDPVVVQFLLYKSGGRLDSNDFDCYIAKYFPTETLDNFPSPRAWTRLAHQLYLLGKSGKYSDRMVEALAVGAVGQKCGFEFYAYYKAVRKLPSPAHLIGDDIEATSEEERIHRWIQNLPKILSEVEALLANPSRVGEGETSETVALKILSTLAGYAAYETLKLVETALNTNNIREVERSITRLNSLLYRLKEFTSKFAEVCRKHGIKTPEEMAILPLTMVGNIIGEYADKLMEIATTERQTEMKQKIEQLLKQIASFRAIAERIKSILSIENKEGPQLAPSV